MKVVDEKDLNKPQEVKTEKAKNIENKSDSVQYTMIVSGLRHGRDIELKGKNHTDNLVFLFDSVTDYSLSREQQKTDFAVEDGTTKSDHVVIKDRVLKFTAKVSSAPQQIYEQNYIDRNTDPDNPAASGRPAAALQALNEIIDKRQLVMLVTEEDIYEDMCLTNMEASRSANDGDCLTFNFTFTEFRTFQIRTVEADVYTDPKKIKKSKQKGIVTDQSKDSNVAAAKVGDKPATTPVSPRDRAYADHLEASGMLLP